MLKAYVGYLVGDGQKLLPQIGYAPLPANIDQMATAQTQQDRHVIVSFVMQADQIGSMS